MSGQIIELIEMTKYRVDNRDDLAKAREISDEEIIPHDYIKGQRNLLK